MSNKKGPFNTMRKSKDMIIITLPLKNNASHNDVMRNSNKNFIKENLLTKQNERLFEEIKSISDKNTFIQNLINEITPTYRYQYEKYNDSSSQYEVLTFTQIVEMMSYYTAMNLTYREQMTLILSFSKGQ